jgi:5-histidylcysteine sulfoxide synthase
MLGSTTMTLTRNPNLSAPNPSAQNGSGNVSGGAVERHAALTMHPDAKPAGWWTGLAPEFGVCPGVDRNGKIHSLPQLNLLRATRQEILDYFNNSWTLTEVLFSALVDEEAYFTPPYHGLRHPLIFYYAHPAVLYVNKLRLARMLPGPIDGYFEHLFETGVDEMSWDDLSKNEMKWPSVEDVRGYRSLVYTAVKDVILNSEFLAESSLPINRQSPAWALAMAFEHERIHFETSSVLIRETPLQMVQTPKQWPDLAVTSSKETLENKWPCQWIDISAREVAIGRGNDDSTFGWDNEFGKDIRAVQGFSATRFLVSNREFLEFVSNEGYQLSEHWSEEGWRWRNFRNVKWPSFWIESGPQGIHQFQLRTCFEAIPLPLNWPAIVMRLRHIAIGKQQKTNRAFRIAY